MAEYFYKKLVIFYFSGVRGVERYEHASLAASLEKNINAKKNNYLTVYSYSMVLFNQIKQK